MASQHAKQARKRKKTLKLLAKYMYHLNKRPSYSDNPEWYGVDNADDLYLVFGISFQYGSDIDRNDKIVSALMMNYWANFAKHGIL